jgi:phage terminase small subunit
MPTPRKPPHLKLLSGSRQPDPGPAIDLPVLEVVPPPPEWLPNAHAVNEWKRLALVLTANRLLTEASLGALGVLCAIHGEIVDLWSRRVSPTGHLLAQYRNLSNDFGMTPISRSKVRTDAPHQPNLFSQNGKRPK